MLQDTKLGTNAAAQPINIDTKNINHDMENLDLKKTDSATSEGLSSSPIESKIRHRRTSSTVSGVFNINDLEKEGADIQISIETQKTGWKLNTSPNSIADPDLLKVPLCTPPIKKIDLVWPSGLSVTARNMKGVTIKDALEAIYKQFKKKADDELDDKPILAGFEWDREECYTRFIVHQKKEGAPISTKKTKKEKKAEEEANAAAS